jgi:hypothetical protein
MSEIKVNKISPKQTCTQVTLGDSGDTFIIPAGVTLTNSGTATGFGPTGAVSWNTTAVTSSPLTAASGVGYFIDTSGGAITVNLPAGSAGAIISLADYTNTWQTNAVTVNANGSEKIGGIAAPAILDTEGQSVTFLYVDATEGWKSVQDSTSNVIGNVFVQATGGTITTCGNYKIHSFTGPGTFTVTNAGTPAGSTTVDYMVVAGGGGGGGRHGGGGGAGGFRTNYPSSCAGIPVTAQAYPIIVGGGGVGGVWRSPSLAPQNPPGSQGSNSVFSTITSTGGGGGGTAISAVSCGAVAFAGGSGGGGTHCGPSVDAGNGNTPPVSPPQGNPGGAGLATAPYDGGGGGGASAAGAAGSSTGNGGAGTANSISGSPTSYAGGGGGGGYGCAGGTGGIGGGGTSGGCPARPGTAATTGTVNTGGGGGGFGGNSEPAPTNNGAAGGSGIVVIRYKFQ